MWDSIVGRIVRLDVPLGEIHWQFLFIGGFFKKAGQMIKRIIVTGDAMTHGGAVISGAPNAKFDGKSIARPGVLVDCPEKYSRGAPHGINKIIEGCKTGCGCASIGSVRGMVSG